MAHGGDGIGGGGAPGLAGPQQTHAKSDRLNLIIVGAGAVWPQNTSSPSHPGQLING